MIRRAAQRALRVPLPLACTVLSLALGASGCADITIEKEAAVDFQRFSSVRVVVSSVNSASDTAYLAQQLRDLSGFETVTTVDTEPFSLVLSVNLTVIEEVMVDENGSTDSSWTGEATYVATDPAGVVIDRGSEDDSSEFNAEVAEDVLDEIALHYMRPFRI